MSYNALRKGRFSQPGRAYFITTVTHKRTPWFNTFDNARLLVAHMRQLHDEGAADTLAWVVMPDHLHWLFCPREGGNLSALVKRLKAGFAQDLNRRLGRSGAVWQKSFHDHALRDNEDVRQVARYIVANPLRAGLVERIGDYPHWDAVWLKERPCEIGAPELAFW